MGGALGGSPSQIAHSLPVPWAAQASLASTAGLTLLGSSTCSFAIVAAGFNAAVLMLFRICRRLVFELLASGGLLRALDIFLETTTGSVAAGLMTLLRAGNFWDTTGLAARFTADVLVTFLSAFACSAAAKPQDVRAKQRHRMSVRMCVGSMGSCLAGTLAKGWAK